MFSWYHSRTTSGLFWPGPLLDPSSNTVLLIFHILEMLCDQVSLGRRVQNHPKYHYHAMPYVIINTIIIIIISIIIMPNVIINTIIIIIIIIMYYRQSMCGGNLSRPDAHLSSFLPMGCDVYSTLFYSIFTFIMWCIFNPYLFYLYILYHYHYHYCCMKAISPPLHQWDVMYIQSLSNPYDIHSELALTERGL